jgi:hypothetical protein
MDKMFPMKLSTLTVVLLFFGGTLAAATPKSGSRDASSPETVVQDFFHYLLVGKRDITSDASAQKRWLTRNLQRALATTVAATNRALKAHPDEKIDVPDNGTFLGAWDPPTTFKVLQAKSAPSQATVEVTLTWGPKTNYPGDVQKRTVALVLEDGAWRIEEITVHAGKFAQAGTLTGELRELSRAH